MRIETVFIILEAKFAAAVLAHVLKAIANWSINFWANAKRKPSNIRLNRPDIDGYFDKKYSNTDHGCQTPTLTVRRLNGVLFIWKRGAM